MYIPTYMLENILDYRDYIFPSRVFRKFHALGLQSHAWIWKLSNGNTSVPGIVQECILWCPLSSEQNKPTCRRYHIILLEHIILIGAFTYGGNKTASIEALQVEIAPHHKPHSLLDIQHEAPNEGTKEILQPKQNKSRKPSVTMD